jgi:hypothetical protein
MLNKGYIKGKKTLAPAIELVYKEKGKFNRRELVLQAERKV